MSDFTKLQKDKILNYLYKNFKKIDFDNIDQDIFLKKIGDLVFFDKKELLFKISSLFFEDLDKRFLTEIKSKINKITKTNEKISFLLNKRFQVEKKNKDLIKKFFIHLIKDNNSSKVLTYIYSVSDIMWKYANDRSVDFNYYTKRLILSSVYLKILILSFYKDNLTQKDLNEEISKSLEHVKLISQLKIKLDFFKNLNNDIFPAIVKTTRLGYDGKGQVFFKNKKDFLKYPFKSKEYIIEKLIDFKKEISIAISKNKTKSVSYDAFENLHKNQILQKSHIPANISAKLNSQAKEIAKKNCK